MKERTTSVAFVVPILTHLLRFIAKKQIQIKQRMFKFVDNKH